MGMHHEISPELQQWIEAQSLYFVASAPLTEDGHINLSPRGYDTLRITGPLELVFLDLTGSGNETAAQLAENGRITVMLCAFSGDPKILRLYGRGEVLLPDSGEWDTLRGLFDEDLPGVRQIVRISVDMVKTSCGFGVPLMEPVGERKKLLEWAEKKGESGIREYWQKKNAVSIDNLPAQGRSQP
ncbi:pyridoxamine 5'-phosphate oxidase [Solemya pervernicosa gill symbiont]|uniref:Pyridoxamine 5'-phosphate oxidase n=2 Tax=Gammaproteobacteria incertae sedis TaxID=118884 RepID=A0A1T2LB79_9GAMM|nr:pyridoxamine 5'-phosphate oxidase family protein [Candidatus Reidiella endopervernicosa]OOZ42272.1 pyridoxamine 5'-phosphate oxidase [Solemya pervernicosa gill symbiont]QKQ25669.1 pyridoxamine 5'-phosphate oxidase family protein [Candidatus Reidiella endopervernicosa]